MQGARPRTHSVLCDRLVRMGGRWQRCRCASSQAEQRCRRIGVHRRGHGRAYRARAAAAGAPAHAGFLTYVSNHEIISNSTCSIDSRAAQPWDSIGKVPECFGMVYNSCGSLRGGIIVRPARSFQQFLRARKSERSRMMKVGLCIFPTHYAASPAAIARAAEDLGFESLWFPEHPCIPVDYETRFPGSADGKVPRQYWSSYDPFVALAYAASATKRLKIATGICLLAQRDPIVTAKAVASLDVL